MERIVGDDERAGLSPPGPTGTVVASGKREGEAGVYAEEESLAGVELILLGSRSGPRISRNELFSACMSPNLPDHSFSPYRLPAATLQYMQPCFNYSIIQLIPIFLASNFGACTYVPIQSCACSFAGPSIARTLNCDDPRNIISWDRIEIPKR